MMKRYINIIFGALIFIAVLLILSDISKNQNKPTPNTPEERYFISSKEKPSIREAIFKPLDFVSGEEQIVYVKLENETPIEKVTAEVSTDKKVSKFELKLFEGNEKIGTWRGSWRINDTHSHTYTTTIKAVSGSDTSSVDLSFPLGTKRQIEKPQTDSNILIKLTALLILVLIFISVKTRIFRKLFRKVLIFLITIALTVSFIPGIFNLKPQKAYAAIPSGVIVMWPSTNASIPSGWSRVTALDGRYPKMIATSATNPGATGGASSHSHSSGGAHSHSASHGSGGTSGAASDFGTLGEQGGTVVQAASHTHSLSGSTVDPGTDSQSPAYNSTTTEPPYFEVIFIKSDGTPTGFPNGTLAFFNAAAPTGWTAHAGSNSRLFKGAAAAGNGGGTGGTGNAHAHTATATHTHSVASHTHTITMPGSNTTYSALSLTNSLPVDAHTHTGSITSGAATSTTGTAQPTTDNGDMNPPWVKPLVIENTSGSASFPVNIITMWDGILASIPSGWFLADGNAGRPNLSQNKFVMGNNASGSIGTTGGATTHTHSGGSHSHSDSHSHTGSGTSDSTTAGNILVYGGNTANVGYPSQPHSHSFSGISGGSISSANATAAANSDNDPLFTGVAYITFSNSNPNAPTIMGSSPIPGSKPNKNATTITLQGTATDADVSDTVQIDWDYSSNSGGAWTNIGTTTLGTQGTTQSLSWTVSGLTAASTYRLRARTIDNGAATSSYTTQSSDWTLTSGCSPPVSGNLTIAASCAFPETVDGVDAGSITINSSVTLTINSGQTVAFNSGQTISPNGDIARTATGQIRKTNLWMVDSDADGWPATAVQSAQDSTPGGTYRRRNLLNSDRIIDCNDAASSSTNSC